MSPSCEDPRAELPAPHLIHAVKAILGLKRRSHGIRRRNATQDNARRRAATGGRAANVC